MRLQLRDCRFAVVEWCRLFNRYGMMHSTYLPQHPWMRLVRWPDEDLNGSSKQPPQFILPSDSIERDTNNETLYSSVVNRQKAKAQKCAEMVKGNKAPRRFCSAVVLYLGKLLIIMHTEAATKLIPQIKKICLFAHNLMIDVVLAIIVVTFTNERCTCYFSALTLVGRWKVLRSNQKCAEHIEVSEFGV